MANKKSSRAGRKARFVAYAAESRREKNRATRLDRHLDKHPNDRIALIAATSPTPKKNPPRAKGRGSEGFSGYAVVGTRKGHKGKDVDVYALVGMDHVAKPGYLPNTLLKGRPDFRLRSRLTVEAFNLLAEIRRSL